MSGSLRASYTSPVQPSWPFTATPSALDGAYQTHRPSQVTAIRPAMGSSNGSSSVPAVVLHDIRRAVMMVGLQYASNVLANPWEVGKVLLSAQSIPRERPEGGPALRSTVDDEDAALDEDDFDLDDEETMEHFFERRMEDSGPVKEQMDDAVADTDLRRRRGRSTTTKKDQAGYLVSTQQDAVVRGVAMPVSTHNGVYGMMKRLVKHEGWTALYKGAIC